MAKAADVERARTIMADNHYGWFERVSRGIYGLSEAGRSALPPGAPKNVFAIGLWTIAKLAIYAIAVWVLFSRPLPVFSHVVGFTILMVVLVILGLLALLTPLTPGSWLIPIGLELLGLRSFLGQKLLDWGKGHPGGLRRKIGRLLLWRKGKAVEAAGSGETPQRRN